MNKTRQSFINEKLNPVLKIKYNKKLINNV